MRIDYLDPIIEAAINVMSEYTGAPVERGTMKLTSDCCTTKDVGAIVGVAGEVEGRVILEMGKDTAISIAGALNNEVFTDLTPLALDTLMELTNVLVAHAVSALNDKGFKFRLTPPFIFSGSNLCFFNMNIESLVIPLKTRAGELILNVALRMNVM